MKDDEICRPYNYGMSGFRRLNYSLVKLPSIKILGPCTCSKAAKLPAALTLASDIATKHAFDLHNSKGAVTVTALDAMRLPQVLDMTRARQLQIDLLDRIRNGNVAIDGSDVERIATPCVQVVLAAARACEAGGSTFRIIAVSDAFRAALDDLGLQSEFNRWVN